MCLVCLNAIGSKAMPTADFESDRITPSVPRPITCLLVKRKQSKQVDEEITQPDEVTCGHHRAEVLGLGAAERDRLLHLREPMDEATVVEHEAATDGESHSPTRIDVNVKVAGCVGSET